MIRGEMFSAGYGFVVDYLAEILRHMRNHDYSNRYRELFTLSSDISTRDRDGIAQDILGNDEALFSAGGGANAGGGRGVAAASPCEGRKRVKDQLLRIDTPTRDRLLLLGRATAVKVAVTTLEERSIRPSITASRPPQ